MFLKSLRPAAIFSHRAQKTKYRGKMGLLSLILQKLFLFKLAPF